MVLAEEHHSINLARKNMPNKLALERQLVDTEIELARCQDKIKEYDHMLEHPGEGRQVRRDKRKIWQILGAEKR